MNLPKEDFFVTRYLAGYFAGLDVTACCKAERTLLLRLVAEACRNGDGSHSKSCFKSFFEEVNAPT